ncbi:hypothetical protein SBA3_3770012 [Candidatus Sulfopaludibacter sp. SbA3]|nr:hypothetical protein SBA3_3770012 [Candidatus Sulfopaludibacter sp. SbA3]
MPPEAVRHPGDKVFVPERTAGKCAAAQSGDSLQFLGVDLLRPVRDAAFQAPPVHIDYAAFVDAGNVSRGARPLIVGRPVHHPGAHRIPVHVRKGSPQVLLIEHAGEEAILPEVSVAAGAGVEVLGVAAMDAAQQHRQGVLAVGHGDQVHMIGHQAPSQEADFGIGEVLAKESQVDGAVLIGRKGFAAVDAPLGDVAWQPWQHTSIASRHI